MDAETLKMLERSGCDVSGLKMKTGGAMTTAEREALPDSDFALRGRRYPINDRTHAANALARVAQHGSPHEKSVVRKRVQRRYPDMGKR